MLSARSVFRCCSFYFFFFKQNTAYELRISDWSSDVCSSDLDFMVNFPVQAQERSDAQAVPWHSDRQRVCRLRRAGSRPASFRHRAVRARSEEHTSELQSLMRISYAVFCLKKKKKTNHNISRIE